MAAWARAASFAIVPLAIVGQAHAQERPLEVPETLVEGGDAEGFRLGRLIVQPRFGAEVRHDTNIYNRADAVADTVFVARPAVSLRPDLARHAVRFAAAAELRRYAENGTENSNQWLLSADGRLDLAERTTITPSAHIARRIERRGTFGDQTPGGLEPASYTEKQAAVQIGRSGGRIELSGEIGTRKLDYHPVDDGAGVPIPQSVRDLRQDWVGVKAGIRRSDRLALSLRGRLNQTRYDSARERNSKGFSILAGVRYDISEVLRAEVGAGYMQQDFSNPLEPTFKGIDYSIAVNWTPSPRVRVQASGGRSVERSPLPDVAAVVESRVDAGFTYAIGSRLLAGMDVGLVREDYRGIDRRDTRAFIEATARYRLHPKVSALAGIGWRKQDGRGAAGRDYQGATFRAGITFTP